MDRPVEVDCNLLARLLPWLGTQQVDCALDPRVIDYDVERRKAQRNVRGKAYASRIAAAIARERRHRRQRTPHLVKRALTPSGDDHDVTAVDETPRQGEADPGRPACDEDRVSREFHAYTARAMNWPARSSAVRAATIERAFRRNVCGMPSHTWRSTVARAASRSESSSRISAVPTWTWIGGSELRSA